jgi:DNA-directed RNA polymerase subunit RPC12/RpoP
VTTKRFPSPEDPDCAHRSHYECVTCRKIVCARCGVEMAKASDNWKTLGYWCEACLNKDASGTD